MVHDTFFGFAKELLDQGLASTDDVYGEKNIYDLTIQCSQDIDFYLTLAKNCQGKVLDLGCGTGRVLKALLEAGVDAVGVDYSPHMLQLAREKLEAYGFQPRLLEQDMRELKLDDVFPLIIIPYYSMIYILTDEDRKKVFRAIHKHLTPGGTLAFDFDASKNPIGESFPWLALQGVHPFTNEVLVSVAQMKGINEDLRVMNEINYVFGENKQITVKSSIESSCEATHMQELLAEEGFTITGVYGDYDYLPYQGGNECVIVATSRGNGSC